MHVKKITFLFLVFAYYWYVFSFVPLHRIRTRGGGEKQKLKRNNLDDKQFSRVTKSSENPERKNTVARRRKQKLPEKIYLVFPSPPHFILIIMHVGAPKGCPGLKYDWNKDREGREKWTKTEGEYTKGRKKNRNIKKRWIKPDVVTDLAPRPQTLNWSTVKPLSLGVFLLFFLDKTWLRAYQQGSTNHV